MYWMHCVVGCVCSLDAVPDVLLDVVAVGVMVIRLMMLMMLMMLMTIMWYDPAVADDDQGEANSSRVWRRPYTMRGWCAGCCHGKSWGSPEHGVGPHTIASRNSTAVASRDGAISQWHRKARGGPSRPQSGRTGKQPMGMVAHACQQYEQTDAVRGAW